jgi:uncharacterized protein (DUF924 family)
MNANDVLSFWFGNPTDADYRKSRTLWFAGAPDSDALIRQRFGEAVEQALRGGYADWCATAQGTLALVLLLDQLTRNVFRRTPRAFAGDARALELAQTAVSGDLDRLLAPTERWFLYMPFEHAESRAAQARSVALFEKLADETGASVAHELGLDGALDYARRHAAVVQRFGRFPHRNAILGRTSTAEERAFLAQPDSSF